MYAFCGYVLVRNSVDKASLNLTMISLPLPGNNGMCTTASYVLAIYKEVITWFGRKKKR